MTIKYIDAFDLYKNGSIVLRTVADKQDGNYRYSWYIKQGNKIIFKSNYTADAFMLHKVDQPGTYEIIFFLRNEQTKEKLREQMTLDVVFSESGAPVRQAPPKTHVPAKPQQETARSSAVPPKKADPAPKPAFAPKVAHISGPFWHMIPEKACPEGAKYSWYIYKAGNPTPVFKRSYSDDPEYVHKFQNAGKYYVKLSVLVNGEKQTAISRQFMVSF